LPVDAVMLTIVALLTVATVMVLLRAPGHPWDGALALSLWLGVVGAPKNSLWNFTPLLLAITFVFARLAGRWWLAALGVLGWLLIELQAQLDGARETIYQASPALAWFLVGRSLRRVHPRRNLRLRAAATRTSGRPAPLAESGLGRAGEASRAGLRHPSARSVFR
jgi:hypothetical protein